MWICRVGKDAVYYDYFLQCSRIFLAWDGFKVDLSKYASIEEARLLVEREKRTKNVHSISNWAGQLISFSQGMSFSDYVLVPSYGSHYYALTKITGDYLFVPDGKYRIVHQRDVRILLVNIPNIIFPQTIQYGLRAYRTVYKVKQEETILSIINKWNEDKRDINADPVVFR